MRGLGGVFEHWRKLGGWLGFASLFVACAGAGEKGDAGMEPPPSDDLVRARFEVSAAPMAWGAIPWPDDLYLDASGHVAVTDLPLADSAYAELLADALTDLDGFGTRPTVSVPFDGKLDASALPRNAAASLMPAASVFMLDADTSSPDVFARIAVDVELSSDGRSVVARPAFGRSLQPGRRYALVVTDRLRSDDGHAVSSAESFAVMLAPDALATDALEQRVRAEYTPILEALAVSGTERATVVALAVFRVQQIDRDLDDARALVRGLDPAALVIRDVVAASALDAVLGEAMSGDVGLRPGRGIAHEHIAALVHVRVSVQTLASVAAGERTAFERNGQGELRMSNPHDVPCSITIPRSNAGGAALPIVLMQHGLARDRSDALALANELAAVGHAVLTCDAPLHGSRGPAGDDDNRFTGASTPDGFGDGFGDLLGSEESAGALGALHPFYYRDAFRQSVVEWMTIVRALNEGAWDSALADALSDASLEGALALARSDFGFVGVDMGAEIGLALSGEEPTVGALVLGFAGGLSVDDWLSSPGYPAFATAIGERLGAPDLAADAHRLARVDLDMLRALLDRASGSAYAPRTKRSAANVLLLLAVDDELAPNASTEAVAHAVGAALVGAEPRFEPELAIDLVLPGTAITGNFDLRAGSVTRVAQALDPATRDALIAPEGSVLYAHPLEAPFTPLDEPAPIENPTAAALHQIVFFFESYRACRATEPDPNLPCAASVTALTDSR